MKPWYRSRWIWMTVILAWLIVVLMLFLEHDVTNEIHPILDKLSTVSYGERWSHPEIVKLRQFGERSVPLLRRVLREKDTPATHFLLWVKGKWPGVTKVYPYIPDPSKMAQRRAIACQVLQMLGPAAKSARPELINIIAGKDPGEVNAAVGALWAAGIDADICEQLDEVLEQGTSGFGRVQIVSALGSVKPPSARTLNALVKSLSDTSPGVPKYAAESLGRLGVASPVVVSGLKGLLATSSDDLTIVTASAALWDLEKDAGSITGRVFQVLASELQKPLAAPLGGGSGGQGVNGTEQTFLKAGELFQQIYPNGTGQSNALAPLQAFCEKSGRIFIRMLMLPSMMQLGLSREECMDVCTTGLNQEEVYYRLQAAELLARVSERFHGEGINPEPLLKDKDLGVRVYACLIHWRKNRRATDVVPILIDALDRNKHQSYYYAQILPAALNSLGEIGPQAVAAVQGVEALTKDPNPNIAKLATTTLSKIRKNP